MAKQSSSRNEDEPGRGNVTERPHVSRGSAVLGVCPRRWRNLAAKKVDSSWKPWSVGYYLKRRFKRECKAPPRREKKKVRKRTHRRFFLLVNTRYATCCLAGTLSNYSADTFHTRAPMLPENALCVLTLLS